MKWKLMDFGEFNGVENMAIDMEMMNSSVKNDSAILRFYAWKPPALSLGRFQSIDDIDVEKTKKMGFDIVRRPSGGRAVLHYDELTYAVSFPEDAVPSSVLRTYLQVSQALVRGFEKVGVEAVISRKRPKESYTRFAACFATTSMHEIEVDDKKLVGSAQVRKHGAVLQHGSIPIVSHVDEYVETFKLSKKHAQTLKKLLREKTTCLSEHITVHLEDLIGALVEGFEETFECVFSPLKEEIDFLSHIEDVKVC